MKLSLTLTAPFLSLVLCVWCSTAIRSKHELFKRNLADLVKRNPLGATLSSPLPSLANTNIASRFANSALKKGKGAVNKAKSINSHFGFGSLNVVKGDEWKARVPRNTHSFAKTPSKVVIHHTASRSCSNQPECVSLLQEIQKYRIDVLGANNVGYNFMIGGDGRIYEGLGWSKYTNMTGIAKHDNSSLHVAFLGDFSRAKPNDAQMRAYKRWEQHGDRKDYIKSFRIHGHRDLVCTSCPGDALYAKIKEMTRYQALNKSGNNVCPNTTLTSTMCL